VSGVEERLKALEAKAAVEAKPPSSGGGPSMAVVGGGGAGVVGVAYVVGAVSRWLQLHASGLPADEALSITPRDVAAELGIRQVLLPALLAGVVIGAGFWLAHRYRDKKIMQGAFPAAVGAGGMLAAMALVTPSALLGLCIVGVLFGLVAVAIGRLVDRAMARAPQEIAGLVVVAATVFFSAGTFVGHLVDTPPLNQARVLDERDRTVVQGSHVATTSSGVYVGRGGRLVFVPLARAKRVCISDEEEAPLIVELLEQVELLERDTSEVGCSRVAAASLDEPNLEARPRRLARAAQ
jgi:uncharacterized protein YneF (UPF0154 family)